MARTLKGNLTGKAAQTALREFRESLNERPSSLDKTHVMNICKQIHLIMGDEYGAWVEAQSNDNAEFKAAAIAKLAELEARYCTSCKPSRKELAMRFDWTPDQNMPEIDMETVEEVEF